MEETTRIYKQRLIMDCKDLMIGDLVYVHEPECKGHRIDAIDELDGQVGADGEVYDECDIRPIPLAEEILVKNGFKGNSLDGYYYWQDADRIELDGNFGYHGIVINYVHQLQHLLRLYGIEKEIEL